MLKATQVVPDSSVLHEEPCGVASDATPAGQPPQQDTKRARYRLVICISTLSESEGSEALHSLTQSLGCINAEFSLFLCLLLQILSLQACLTLS